MIKETTTRVHMNPNEALGTLEHVRSRAFRSRESHIDALNGRFEVWKDQSVYDAYDELFGDYIRDYNKRQKTKSRRILDDNGDEIGGYIEKVQTSRRGKRERVVTKNMPDGTKETVGKRQESQGSRVLYELIVSAGNTEKQRDGRGMIVYTDDGHEVHPMRVPYEVNKAAVRIFCENFEKFYPHLHLTTVGWHADEYYLNAKRVKEYGVEHAHLCFIPWASGYQRGLPVQASISKALEQMGFVNGLDGNGEYRNQYSFFTLDAQERFEAILQDEYVKYQKAHGEATPELHFVHPARGKNLLNVDPARYRELKIVEGELNAAQVMLEETNARLNEAMPKLEDAEATIAEAAIIKSKTLAESKRIIENAQKRADRIILKGQLDGKVEGEKCAKREIEKAKVWMSESAEKYYAEVSGNAEAEAEKIRAGANEEAERIRSNANTDAEKILSSANEEAEKVRSNARDEAEEIEKKYESMREQCEQFMQELEDSKDKLKCLTEENLTVAVPEKMLEEWMKSHTTTNPRTGKREKVYDAFRQYVLLHEQRKRDKAKRELQEESSRRCRMVAEWSLKEAESEHTEDDVGYGY